MPTKLAVLFSTLIAAFLVIPPIAYKRWHDKEYRNFHVVEEGVLYRSGQLPLPRLQQMVYTQGIRTIVCLRTGNDPIDQQEEAWAKAVKIKFVRIPPPIWWPNETGKVPAEAALQTFRDVMDDPANYPVLVHCFAGIHRTGAFCAVFRMDYQGWTNEEAMAEMRALGYSILDDHEDVQGFMVRYQPPQSRTPRQVPGQVVSRPTSAP
jgi:tyrosine-protein phosphatase SIW14